MHTTRPGRSRRRRFILIGLILLPVLAAAGVVLVDSRVTRSTRAYLYSELDALPHRRVGLLLGTAKFIAGGRINLYYKYRIEAAVALYKAGKVDFILVSGDNGTKEYNEPETMRDDLVAAGIPGEKIFLDYAGFRTLDSIVRCKEVFGEQSITVISQPFHNARAIFLARHKGLDAVGFNARDVKGAGGAKVQMREKGARVKMLLDLWFGKEPKYGGPRVIIG